jgi:Cof subfamily protein (haloacid dehalogenase superfamily)
MIKLVATDIDGTLIEEGYHTLDPRIAKLIHRLKEKGIVFVAASGRQYLSMKSLFRDVEDDIIFVSENGAYVVCQGNEIDEIVIDRGYVSKLIRELRQLKDCSFFASTKGKVYTESIDKDFLDLIENGYKYETEIVEDIISLSDKLNIMKISLYNKNGIDQIANSLIPRWEDKLQASVSGHIWLDFVDFRVNKGHAIEKIQETLKIGPEETMVFGDNINDLGMFEKAKYAYAVANAREEVKAAASHITDTNINGGVIKVLETLI